MITIISVDKKNQFAREIAEFEKRLRTPFNLNWILLANSAKSGNDARRAESAEILEKLLPSDFVILLDERGEQMTSPDFSQLLASKFESNKNVKIVIGGAFGVDKKLRERASKIISLSGFVLPHQIVRLVLAEQIYRAQCIASGHPYHHE